MDPAEVLLQSVEALVRSEDFVSHPGLTDELKALLAAHGLLKPAHIAPNILEPEKTLLHAFERFISSEGCQGNRTLVNNLRSALRLHVLPHFGFSTAALKKLDLVLQQFRVEDFRGIEPIFMANIKGLLESKAIALGTFRAYKWALLRFLAWLQSEKLYPSGPELPAVADQYAPRLGNGPKQKPFANLTRARKGKRWRKADPYALKEAELNATLLKQLEAGPRELTKEAFNLALLQKFVKKTTDWLPDYGLRYFLTAKEVPKRQDPPLRAVTFRTRRGDILRFLGWLRQYKGVPLEDLCLEFMADRDILEEFICWGINERGNTYAWAGQYAAASLNIAKWLHHKRSKKPMYEDVSAITTLRDYARDLDHKRKIQGTNIEAEKEEKFLTFEECEQLVAYLKQCCAPRRKYYREDGSCRSTAGRSDRAIISAWQHYLIVAILVYCGIRQREIRELELGKTLFREADGYWVKQAPEDHKIGSKTGQGKEFQLPEHLTEDLDEWFKVWRPKMSIQGHNQVFALMGSQAHPEAMGKPFTESLLGNFVTHRVYKATSFLFQEPKRINPHFFRNIIITHQRKHGDPSQKEPLATMMGQSVGIGDKTYNLMTRRERTAKVQNWWKSPST